MCHKNFIDKRAEEGRFRRARRTTTQAPGLSSFTDGDGRDYSLSICLFRRGPPVFTGVGGTSDGSCRGIRARSLRLGKQGGAEQPPLSWNDRPGGSLLPIGKAGARATEGRIRMTWTIHAPLQAGQVSCRPVIAVAIAAGPASSNDGHGGTAVEGRRRALRTCPAAGRVRAACDGGRATPGHALAIDPAATVFRRMRLHARLVQGESRRAPSR